MVQSKSNLQSKQWARWLIPVGFSLALLGIGMSYQLERHSFERTDDFRFLFLEQAFIPVLLIGLLLGLVGCLIWAWHASIRALLIYGASFASGSLLFARLDVVNVHGWTATLLPTWMVGVLLSIVFVSLGLVRFGLARFHEKNEKPSEK